MNTRHAIIATLTSVLAVVCLVEGGLRTRPDPGGRAARFADYLAPTDGLRRVVGQPATYAYTVYLFGSSTMYDLTARDADTIATRLQAQLPDARVINQAEIGGGVRTGLARLKAIDLRAGDVVIFYAGTGDSLGVYSLAIKRREQTYSGCTWLLNTFYYLALVKHACQWVSWSFPAELADPARLHQLAVDMAADYHTVLRQAYAYTTARGARLLHIIEPTIFSLPPQTAAERAIMDSWYLSRDGFGRVLAATIPLLRQFDDVPTIDLTHALDQIRQTGIDVFTDCCHLAAAGDSVIADAIRKSIPAVI